MILFRVFVQFAFDYILVDPFDGKKVITHSICVERRSSYISFIKPIIIIIMFTTGIVPGKVVFCN
jgi:hypothetical protein